MKKTILRSLIFIAVVIIFVTGFFALQHRHLSNQELIKINEAYVKDKLGEENYNKYVTFHKAYTYKMCGWTSLIPKIELSGCGENEGLGVEYYYNIPLRPIDSHDTDTLNYASTENTAFKFEAKSNYYGKDFHYFGPVKPYNFLITQQEAINRFKSYGLTNISEIVVGTKYVEGGTFSIVWKGKDLSTNEEVFIDVDSGELLK
jgi:hypothetical protein